MCGSQELLMAMVGNCSKSIVGAFLELWDAPRNPKR